MDPKKVELWKLKDENRYLIIDPKDIVKKISFKTDAYIFDPSTDIAILHKALAEYRIQKEKDPYLAFFDILDRYSIKYDTVDDVENYYPDALLCFPDDKDIEQAICKMRDIEGISDVYEYFDGSEWRTIWAETDVQHRMSIIVDAKSVESLDRWSCNFGWCYRRRFNHGHLYKITSIDNEPVDDKYLILEFGEWYGALNWGKIVEEKDLDKIRNWDKETANKEE